MSPRNRKDTVLYIHLGRLRLYRTWSYWGHIIIFQECIGHGRTSIIHKKPMKCWTLSTVVVISPLLTWPLGLYIRRSTRRKLQTVPELSFQFTPYDWHDLLELAFISLPVCQAGVLTYPFTKTWFYPLLQFSPSLFILFYSFPEAEIFTTISSNFLPPLQQVCYLVHFCWLLYFSGVYETKLWSFWSFTVSLVRSQNFYLLFFLRNLVKPLKSAP